MREIPEGKGIYFWRTDQYDAEKVAKACVDLDLDHIVIKVADGRAPFVLDQTKHLVATIRQAVPCIAIFGYQYTYGVDPAGEAGVFASLINDLDLEGAVIDAEGEYRRLANNNAVASAYIGKLRAGLADHRSIGLSTYRFPVTHQPDFPWQGFLQGGHLDFNYPQLYWLQGQPVGQLHESIKQYKQIGYTMPYIPVGPLFPWGNWNVTAQMVTDFMQEVNVLQLPGFSFWKLESLFNRPDLEQAIIDHDFWKEVTPPPDDDDDDNTGVDLLEVLALIDEAIENHHAMADLLDEIRQQVEGLAVAGPPPDQVKGVKVTSEKAVVREAKGENKAGYPIMVIKEPRIIYNTGDLIAVEKDQVKADGGSFYWKLLHDNNLYVRAVDVAEVI